MTKLSAAIVALFAVILALLIMGTHSDAATISPTRHACIAFQQWNHHKTLHSARIMLAASRHAREPIKTDLIVLYTEYVQHDTYDLPADIPLTAIDCSHVR